MIDRDGRWHQFNGVIVVLGSLNYFGMQNRNHHEDPDDHSLHSIAENKLRPRRVPGRERREQDWL